MTVVAGFRATRGVLSVVVMAGMLAGRQSHSENAAVQATAHDGQRTTVTSVAEHVAGAQLAAIAGDQKGVQRNADRLLVLVGGARDRNRAMVDSICDTLAPLGDTLGLVVNVQDVTATTAAGADAVSRNCPKGSVPSCSATAGLKHWIRPRDARSRRNKMRKVVAGN